MFNCNLTFVNAVAELESSLMCDYVNYHIIMLVLFGSFSIALTIATVALIICYGDDPSTEENKFINVFLGLVLVTILLSSGLEGAVIIIDLILFLHILYNAVRRLCVKLYSFILWLKRSSLSMISFVFFRSTENDSKTIGIIQSCPICLETDTGPWITTSCEHTFHKACIRQWQHRTCPLCRGMMV
jgi:hypothetical protein